MFLWHWAATVFLYFVLVVAAFQYIPLGLRVIKHACKCKPETPKAMRVRVIPQLLFKTIAVVYNNISIYQVLEFFFALAHYGCNSPLLTSIAFAAGILHVIAVYC